MGAGRSVVLDGVAGVFIPTRLPDEPDVVVVGKVTLKPEDIDWYALIDMVWHEMTVSDACKEMGYEFHDVYKHMGLERRKYFVEVSMMANVKKEYLEDEGGC